MRNVFRGAISYFKRHCTLKRHHNVCAQAMCCMSMPLNGLLESTNELLRFKMGKNVCDDDELSSISLPPTTE